MYVRGIYVTDMEIYSHFYLSVLAIKVSEPTTQQEIRIQSQISEGKNLKLVQIL